MKQEKMFVAATALTALAIPALVAFGKAQPRSYYVPSGSMEPTLRLDSTIRVQKNPYKNMAQVRRGDIIVHTVVDKNTRKPTEAIRRVVGLPGDKVRLSGTNVWINGRQLSHTLLRRAGKVALYRETNGQAVYQVQYGGNTVSAPAFSTTVSAGQLLRLGDNRDNAYDSRFTGNVLFGSVNGKKLP